MLKKNVAVACAALGMISFGLFHARPASAGPADYIYTPTVTYGEREIGIKYGSAAAGSSAQVAGVGAGYGVSETWFTEAYLKRERIGGQDATLAEWENKFQLTETGRYPVDIGFISELELPLSGNSPWELRLGPLLQTEFGKIQLNGNILFERAFGRADENGVPFCTNLAYQGQLKYRWKPAVEFGVQALGALGKWDNWSPRAEQQHSIGPAVFGKIGLGNRQAIKYNAAWLVGASAATANHTIRMQLEYEF